MWIWMWLLVALAGVNHATVYVHVIALFDIVCR